MPHHAPRDSLDTRNAVSNCFGVWRQELINPHVFASFLLPSNHRTNPSIHELLRMALVCAVPNLERPTDAGRHVRMAPA